MENSLLSSSPLRKHHPGDEWRTPERAKTRGWRADGKSYGQIKKMTGLERSMIQRIIKAPSSRRTTRKGKSNKSKLLKKHHLDRVIKWVSASWENRRLHTPVSKQSVKSLHQQLLYVVLLRQLVIGDVLPVNDPSSQRNKLANALNSPTSIGSGNR